MTPDQVFPGPKQYRNEALAPPEGTALEGVNGQRVRRYRAGMEALGIALRRTPLGQLPAARHGIPAAEAGLVLLPYEQTLLTHHAATEVEPDYLIPVGTRRPPARLALRIHGAGAPQALLERHAFGPIHPRFKRRPGSAQDTRLHQLLQPGPYVATDATIRPSRDYLSVTTYDETVLPLADLLVITDDSALAFGWLSSKAFWIWQQMVAQAEPRATTHRAYTTFPAPKLTAKQRQALEVAVDTVLRARGYALNDDLTALYETPPQALQGAHDELDAVTNELLGLPRNATNQQISERLEEMFNDLIAA